MSTEDTMILPDTATQAQTELDAYLVTQSEILAYIPRTHRFKVVLVNRLGEEKLVDVFADSDRFCNVITAIRSNPAYQNWSILDSWEAVA